MLTTLHKKGGSGLFDMSVAEDLRNVDEHIIQVRSSLLYIPCLMGKINYDMKWCQL